VILLPAWNGLVLRGQSPIRKEAVPLRTARRLLVTATTLAILAILVPSAVAAPNGPGAFPLHLECEDGNDFDIVAPVGNSFGALVEGTNSVAVLKGQDLDFDGIPDVLVAGFTTDQLIACDTFLDGQLVFVAYVLFTPRRA
jgi:hypothetical protein